MLAIAIPILCRLQVPALQRSILLSIFGMGIFIIIAAILTKLYSLYPPLLTYAYLNWYCREASVCVYVTNLPALWSFILDTFPKLRHGDFTTGNQSSSDRSTPSRISRAPRGKDHSLQKFNRLDDSIGMSGSAATESQEHISGLQINKDTTISVRRELRSDDEDLVALKALSDKQEDSGGCISPRSAV